MSLLIFFALPLATILLAIVLQKVLHRPILVAITFFAIYLIVLFVLFAEEFIVDLGAGLIAIIVYTILAFITAYIVKLIRAICERFFNNRDSCNCWNNHRENPCGCPREDNNDLLRISYRCNNGNSQDLLTINSNCSRTDNDNNEENGNNNCGCQDNNNNNNNNNGTRIFFNRKCHTKSV